MSRGSTAPVSSRIRSDERGLAVVDVGDDAEIPDPRQIHDRIDATNGSRAPWLVSERGLGPERPAVASSGSIERIVVANIKSQIKRNRQNEKRAERNKAVRSELKTRVKPAVAIGAPARTRPMPRSPLRSGSTRPPPRA